ncbi:MAG TPA: hypothetical protein VKI45_03075 [Allosphingosinicella sp.]|nr:hypothetical protein [Allosphingosinicella sp.]
MSEGLDKIAQSPAAPSSSISPRRKWGDPIVFVLERELSEVHLLLDNLSADATRVATDSTGVALPPLLKEGDWIERVCEINWPPEADEQSPKDAALLIAAKDYLNRLAWPADGSTIAFTLLVTQPGACVPDDETAGAAGTAPSRGSLARRAYPDLVASAVNFRRWMSRLNAFLLFWLVFTCLLSWNVAFGNAALREFTAADTAFAEARTVTSNTPAKAASTSAQHASGTGPSGSTGAEGRAENALSAAANQCDTATDASKSAIQEPPYTTQPSACWGVMRARHNVALANARLREWLQPWRWLIHVGDIEGDASSAASRFVTIMATAVLPVLYGILGAGAAVVRTLSRKVRKSTLGPRDLGLSLQQLALGAVVGACISLFIAAPGDKSSLIGPVTLSGSAISFIAGFGVEQVFEALQALISRIFNIAPAVPSRPSAGRSQPGD